MEQRSTLRSERPKKTQERIMEYLDMVQVISSGRWILRIARHDKTKEMISKLSKFFEKKTEKSSFSTTITTIKPTKEKEKENTFIGDFNALKTRISPKESASLILEEDRIVSRPVFPDSLSSHICISLDTPVVRPDLEFVTNSKIDGKPIYKYIGKDFSQFDLPYEEFFSAL